MAVQLNTSTYQTLITTINSVLSSGQYRAVTMTVFSDEATTNVVTDSNGIPLLNREFSSTVSKADTVDESGAPINGSVTISFKDGLDFVCTNNVDNLWFTLSGISILSR